MKSSLKILRILALAALVGGWTVGSVQAATITVLPAVQIVQIGELVKVDIVVGGLAVGETVGAFDVMVGWNPAILGAPQSFTSDPNSMLGSSFFDGSGPMGAGSLPLFKLSDIALEADAKALQGAGFTLAKLEFKALANGVTDITLSTAGVFLSDFLGNAPIPAVARNGSVCVAVPGVPCPVPEPGSMLLVTFGLGAALVARRRLV